MLVANVSENLDGNRHIHPEPTLRNSALLVIWAAGYSALDNLCGDVGVSSSRDNPTLQSIEAITVQCCTIHPLARFPDERSHHCTPPMIYGVSLLNYHDTR